MTAEPPEPSHQERQAALLLRRYLAMPPEARKAALKLLSAGERVDLAAVFERPWWTW